MNLPTLDFELPSEIGVWILLVYVMTMVASAWVLERLGQIHFHRARKCAEAGFEYDESFDHYECPEGERLPLHVIDDNKRVAIYRAPASSCAGCSRKGDCTPHDQGRHLYRPLATWAETDSGRFHQWVGVVICASAAFVGGIATVWWTRCPGSGWLLASTVVAATAAFVTGIRTGLAARCGETDA